MARVGRGSGANSINPPTAMFTGPCSAASDERSAGESSSVIAATLLPRGLAYLVTRATEIPNI
jgi:hypothetical protein